ncbi:HK97 family phage prohead protease [Microbacterium allomyrinae]|uniref:HK97 family phage prohead protease n=1 Tax=Microbacterium allomyrinae TaxID=2830666 RepID=A0A9X1LRW7_9MICO|nr:HK97 family phage prohead protease [Microbacterium allomyrinae]MCC2030621.1 HK97 family phage prohead protease [Microbacterium allomyrinae]
MTHVIERRVVDRPVEFRAAVEGGSGPGILTGYGAVFDFVSRDLGGWFEEIDPGAFGPVGDLDLSLHTRVLCRAEHSNKLLLGTTDAGTLRCFVDDVGLRYEDDLPDTNAGRDVAVLAERGDYRHSSFAFNLRTYEDAEWREDRDGRLIRRIMRAVVHDVAPVADPAYWGATTEMQRAFDLDTVRASLTPSPAAPGDRELDVARRAAFMTRETHPALVTRPRKRGI